MAYRGKSLQTWKSICFMYVLKTLFLISKLREVCLGLQFLISATAWYCKLCDTWVGDLHCASQHLKSQNHNQNYAVNFSFI